MELSHKFHQHKLFLVDREELGIDEVFRCWFCENDICGASYSCFGCPFHLHKSCAELPLRWEDHPFHPQHPLALRPRSSDTGGCRCDACDVLADGVVYHCSICNFNLHTMCAESVYQKDIIFSEIIEGKSLFRYGAHQHLLTLEEEQSTSLDTNDNYCIVCSYSISAPFFSCSKSPCRFSLHQSCADLPQILHNNSFHPQHPLFLVSLSRGECQICGQKGIPPAYVCKPCDFSVHPRCAFSNPIDNFRRMGEKQILHFTHYHLLTCLQNEGEYAEFEKRIPDDTPYCNLCGEEVASFPGYGCQWCPFILHKSCAELPPLIKTHLHLDHFLFLFARPPGGKAITYCDCCAAEITHFNYQCVQCGFTLHVDCFLSQHGSNKLYGHKHCFINLKNFHELTCQTCGEKGYFSPWQCSSCHIMVHKRCADLPRILKLESHDHNLTLTYYLSSVHECDKMDCRLCFIKVNVDYAAYYCSKSGCNYAAHLNCAPKVGVLISEEEDEFDQNSSKESQNSMTDITSSLVEGNKSGVIQHFSHQHELTLMDQDPEDHKYCEGCVRLISPPFYSCKQCNFYLHKKCGELPMTKKHPFHPHLLNLNGCGEVYKCDECLKMFNGFMYSCQTPNCTFKLDLQCADIFSEGLQHPCHEHPLFFPYTREYEKCRGCGKRQKHIMVCSECDYALGFCCLRIPQVAKHRYDDHLLNLSHKNEDEFGEYYCDICEEKRDPEAWFYCCTKCDFFAHIKCTVAEFPHVKNGTTGKFDSHDHPLTLVEKCERKTPPLCSFCGKHCHSRMFECCQCNIHVHFSGYCTTSLFRVNPRQLTRLRENCATM